MQNYIEKILTHFLFLKELMALIDCHLIFLFNYLNNISGTFQVADNYQTPHR